MHELSISRALLDAALAHAQGRPVTRLHVSIGALRAVRPGSLAFYFEIVAQGTLCEGAAIESRVLPVRLLCGCGAEWQSEDLRFGCPRGCGGPTTALQGDELLLDSIEVEEAACIAPK